MANVPILHHESERIPIVDAVVAGRHTSCDLRITKPGASRQHARFLNRPNGLYVTDLGSSNGTKVNGRKITGTTRLDNGDQVTIGTATIHVELPNSGTASDLRSASAPTNRPAAQARTPSGAKRSPAATQAGAAVASGEGEGSGADRKTVKAHPETLVGTLVAGHRIGDLLGADELGATYRARQLSLSRDVAFTVITSALAVRDTGEADRLLEQLRRAASLNDPNLVPIHECGREGDLLWHTTGFVDGDTVATLLERDGRIDPALALLVVERGAKGLSAAHAAGLAHGDLRPETVMVDRHGQVKVTNLGLAALHRAARGAERTSRSPAHTAPELADGADPTPESDIYALGCLLVHMLTGSPPFTGRHAEAIFRAHRDQPLPVPSEDIPGLPAEIDKLAAGMLAKQPDWRFASIDELLPDLAAARERLTEKPPEPDPAQRPRAHRTPSSALPQQRARRAGPPIGILIGAAVVVVALIVAWPYLQRSMAGPPIDDGASREAEATPPTGESGAQERVPPQPSIEDADAQVRTDLAAAWSETRAKVAELSAADRWQRAERVLLAFRREAEAAGHQDLVRASTALHEPLLLDAARWYTAATADLPNPNSQPRAHLLAVSELRANAASADRRDAARRYRDAAERMRRTLALTRRDMLRAIEGGELDRLEAIAQAIREEFAGTPLASEHARLVTLGREASRMPWSGSWIATQAALPRATDEDRIPAAAALLLSGDRARALRLLLAPEAGLDPTTRQLLADTGRVLDFADPAASDVIRIENGSVETRSDVLTGPPNEPMTIAMPGPATTPWAVELALELDASAAVALASLSQGHSWTLSIEFLDDSVNLHWQTAAGAEGELDLEALDRLWVSVPPGGGLSIRVGDQILATDLAYAAGEPEPLRLSVAGCTWRLDRAAIYAIELVEP